MQPLHVEIPESLHEFVQARAAEGGYQSIGEYLEELIRADQKAAMRRLEQAAIEGLNSERIPLTPEVWASLRERVLGRQQV